MVVLLLVRNKVIGVAGVSLESHFGGTTTSTTTNTTREKIEGNMAQNMKRNNQKKLLKRAIAAYTPGMSVRQLMTVLQVSQFAARQLLYKVRYLESIESR